MKIIKRGKILPLECEKCGTIFKPSFKEIKAQSFNKNYVDCPLCGRSALVQFGKEVGNDRDDKKWFDLSVRMKWLKTIDKELDKQRRLEQKLNRQKFVVKRLFKEYEKRYSNDIFGEG